MPAAGLTLNGTTRTRPAAEAQRLPDRGLGRANGKNPKKLTPVRPVPPAASSGFGYTALFSQ